MKGFGWSNNGSGSPLADGFLQIEGGATISASLQRVVDKAGNNSSLFLANNLVGVSSAIQYDWIATPTGAANKTTMWFDGTGRMNWRPGTGASSFVRTFDATGITADRVYTLPNNTMTFIGTGAAIDSTLRSVVGGGTSPLQLSTSQIGMAFSGVTNPIIWRANGTLTDYSGWHQADGTYRLLTKDGAALFINNANGINIQNGLGSTGRTVINAAGDWTVGGSFTNAARFHVRGDGTNNIIRLENGAGVQALAIGNSGGITIAREGNIGAMIYPFNTSELSPDILGFGLGFSSNKVNFATNNYDVIYTGQAYTTTSGTANYLTIRRTFSAAAGSANFRPLNIEYTINNSGAQTGTATGIFLNATETALNGMVHNFATFQRGGVNYFNVTRTGLVESAGLSFASGGTSSGRILAVTNGVFVMYNSGATDFTRLNFGAQDATRPALQVNGTTLEVRVADGSAFAPIAIGNTVTVAAGVASTHKVQMTIGGTTYYLLASNV